MFVYNFVKFNMVMITVFIFVFIPNFIVCSNKYCHISENHILCKYKFPGPNSKCIGYEKSLLTKEDINIIVDQINRRRNFIALGQSKYFPMAANMKKIVWSNELAEFAQRWVDQCDQSLQPDKEDECHDTENTKVGQSIATITGSSPGVNVKSFVEVWFMQSLNFVGSVTYYNQSLNYKTNYFTQLIWADTVEVGCGKAKFFVKHTTTTIAERLVCNFAPSGNIHRKPVYIIGYAATQCDDNMISDKTFPGLCTNDVKIDRLPSANTTGLLRIRNLFNDSIEQEIDPVYYHLKQIPEDSIVAYIPNNKTFNLLENFDDAIKRSYPLENRNFWINNRNESRYDDVFLDQKEKGPSRAYHGHDNRNIFYSLNPDIKIQHSRRHNEFPTPPANDYNNFNYRKHDINKQCTRSKTLQEKDYHDTGCNCNLNIQKCTRGRKPYYEKSTEKHKKYLIERRPHHRYTNNLCACKKLHTSYPILCNDNKNCECDDDNHSAKCNSRMLKVLANTDSDNLEREDFNYYDPPNLSSEPNMKPLALYINSRRLRNHKKKNNLDYSEMKKRSATKTEATFKPFWQIDGLTKTNYPMLKSIRYTTLPNKKLSKLKRPKSSLPVPVKTEIITITKNNRQDKNNRFTERYLSFDELLHLQKNKSIKYSGRRQDEENNFNEKGEEKLILRESVATKDGSTEYTANTPFIRMKHCTRKLTCTWTAASLTDSAGSIIQGGGGNMGSRTPPGYVEGCTRTSTCTRDFMDRNKIASLPTETTIPVTEDDEDYCERRRRSLNKRIYNRNDNLLNTIEDYFLEKKINMTNQIHIFNSETILNKIIKRDTENSEYEEENSILSYGDLFYVVLNKMFDMWKSKNVSHASSKCLCNAIAKLGCNRLLLFITIFTNLQ